MNTFVTIGFEGFDLASSRTHMLLPAHVSRAKAERFRDALPPLSGHVWLMTSGTSGEPKLVALSKKSLLASAEAVNRTLGSTETDRWLLSLPLYHVGGLGIYARAWLARARVSQLAWKNGRPAWESAEFVDRVERDRVTLTSLVPTQVHDLVAAGRRAPPSLRVVFVGGGALDKPLFERALELGWPLAPTYGMTETASQVAAAKPGSWELRPLPHARFRVGDDDRLEILTEARLSGYVRAESLEAALERGENAELESQVGPEGWLKTEDFARLHTGSDGGEVLEVLGRGSDFLKIQGECVGLLGIETRVRSLAELENELAADALGLLWRPEARRGAELVLAVGLEELRRAGRIGAAASVPRLQGLARRLLERYNAEAPGYARIESVEIVERLPRGDLGKLRRRIESRTA